MADPHPLVEEMARAMARELNAAESPESDQLHVSWLNAALAAARVILSAEPSEEAADAAVCAFGALVTPEMSYPCDEGAAAGKKAWAGAIRASNAALLREIEGSEPAPRDVEP